MRRLPLIAALATTLVVIVGAPAARAQQGGGNAPPPTTILDGESGDEGGSVVPGAPDQSTPSAVTTTTVPDTTLPVGCDPPTQPTAVFIGSVQAKAAGTVRFRIAIVRNGSLEGFAYGNLVDVDFDELDFPLITVGETYRVAALLDPATNRLESKLREHPPLFGGSQVVGVDNKPANCPIAPDLVITKKGDGTSVDTGLLAGFTADKKQIGEAFLKPALVVFGVLVGLVLLKHLLTGGWRVIRHQYRRRKIRRGRRLLLGPSPSSHPTAAPRSR